MTLWRDALGFAFYAILLTLLLHFAGMDALVIFGFAWLIWENVKGRNYDGKTNDSD